MNWKRSWDTMFLSNNKNRFSAGSKGTGELLLWCLLLGVWVQFGTNVKIKPSISIADHFNCKYLIYLSMMMMIYGSKIVLCTLTEWINMRPDPVGGHMLQAVISAIAEKQTTLEGCLKCANSSTDTVNNDGINAQLINTNCPCRNEKVMGSEKLPPSSGLGGHMLTIFFSICSKKTSPLNVHIWPKNSFNEGKSGYPTVDGHLSFYLWSPSQSDV